MRKKKKVFVCNSNFEILFVLVCKFVLLVIIHFFHYAPMFYFYFFMKICILLLSVSLVSPLCAKIKSPIETNN